MSIPISLPIPIPILTNINTDQYQYPAMPIHPIANRIGMGSIGIVTALGEGQSQVEGVRVKWSS